MFETATQPGDGQALARLGKKQVLKRRFGFLSIFGFAVAELITWETVLVLFSQSFSNGGPAGACYGYLAAGFSTMSVYIVISELASMAPIAGGQYYWVYQLAPLRWKKLSSYLIGWLNTLAWIATIATETIFLGTIIEGLIILERPGFATERWHNTLWAWAVVAVAIFVNVVVPNVLPRLEIGILVIHLTSFVAIIVTLLVLSPKSSPSWVFGATLNGGGWPTMGVSWCVGFIGNVATFVGADASVHMAEEIENAAVNLPRAIFAGMGINSLLGFAMMLTILFCLGDSESVLKSPTGLPFIQIYYNVTASYAGVAVMVCIGIALTVAACVGIITTASRMTWAFARDRGLPLSGILQKVDKRTQVPVISCLVVCGLACALTLIYIGSTTAFNDVISLTITGFYSTYLLPSAFLLYHRIKGDIRPHGSLVEGVETASPADRHPKQVTQMTSNTSPEKRAQDADACPETDHTELPQLSMEDSVAEAPLIWGPWRVPGILGTLNNAYSCVYMVFVLFWSVWPPETPVDYTTMNYSVVVTSGVLILSAVWYLVRARKEYDGPVIDEEVASIMHITRPAAVV